MEHMGERQAVYWDSAAPFHFVLCLFRHELLDAGNLGF